MLNFVVEDVLFYYISSFWTLDGSPTASYEITFVRPSVCPTVRH